MNRCLNDPIFGYCYGQPNLVRVEDWKLDFDYRGRAHKQSIATTRCLNNHRTCSQYLTTTQALAPIIK